MAGKGGSGGERKGGQFAPGGGRVGAGPAKEKTSKGRSGGGGKSTGKEGSAKKHADREKAGSTRAAEFRQKAKPASSNVEREAYLHAARQATKKAQGAAQQVDHHVGADHDLSKRAHAHADKSAAADKRGDDQRA